MAPTTATPVTSSTATGVGVSDRVPTLAGPVLVATDATTAADAALIAAQILAERLRNGVEVLTVFEPPPAFFPPTGALAMPTEFDASATERLRQRARQQVQRVVGEEWPIEVYTGEPAATVRRIALERGASLIMTGVSRHGLLDRIFGEETAAHIATIAQVPVLAATPPFTRLPRTVLVAIDLDSTAPVMTPVLRALLSDVSAMYFVNAKPRATMIDGVDLGSWEQMYDEAIAATYERIRGSLDLPGKVTQQLVTLDGPTAKEILNFAEYANVELIIVGQRRASLLPRRFGRGLATRLLRATTCSVLVLPRTDGRASPMAAIPAIPSARTETITDSRIWSVRLAELSRRNAGRTATVEIDDTELGAQAQVSGFPFMGADHDRRDDRIEIMLGARGPGRAHLTHSVTNPTSIDILARADGRLEALRIANARGQVVISFIT